MMTNRLSFYDEMTGLVDEGRAVNIVYLDFSKVVSHNIFKEKLMGWMSRQSNRLKTGCTARSRGWRFMLRSVVGGQ